jgi:methionyl-tRNA formyltransferase
LLKFGRGEIAPIPQDSEKATYAPILKKADGRIDWSRTAQQIYDRMRGFAPWPGAYTTFRGQTCQVGGHPDDTTAPGEGNTRSAGPGEIITSPKAFYVVCGDRTYLRLDSVQLEGRKRISAREFANGARILPGDRFI